MKSPFIPRLPLTDLRLDICMYVRVVLEDDRVRDSYCFPRVNLLFPHNVNSSGSRWCALQVWVTGGQAGGWSRFPFELGSVRL